MKTSDTEIQDFSRDLRLLVDDLRRALSNLWQCPSSDSSPSVVKPAAELENWQTTRDAWGLATPDPIDVPATLLRLKEQLDSVEQRSSLLLVFDRNDPMPWFAENVAEFDDVPYYLVPRRLVDSWRATPPTSFHAATFSFARICVRHLQSEQDSAALFAIASYWYRLLGIVTNGERFYERLKWEVAIANPKAAGQVTLVEPPMPITATADGPINKVESADQIPAEYRVKGRQEGEPLTAAVVDREYKLSGSYLSKNYKGLKLKLGRALVYQHAGIVALTDQIER